MKGIFDSDSVIPKTKGLSIDDVKERLVVVMEVEESWREVMKLGVRTNDSAFVVVDM